MNIPLYLPRIKAPIQKGNPTDGDEDSKTCSWKG
jgi:hypothetical protein